MDYRILGAMLNSALYLISVAFIGVVTNHLPSTYFAIAAMGFAYLSYVAQIIGPDKWYVSQALVWFSIACGVVAGIKLLS